MIRFACPQCTKKFQVEDKAAGKKTKCPKCGAALSVPTAESSDTPISAIPSSAVEPFAAAADADVYGLSEPATPNQDDFWNAPRAASARSSASMPNRASRQGHGARSKGPLLLFLGIGSALVVGITIGVIRSASGTRSDSRSEGSVQPSAARATSTVAKESTTPPAPPKPPEPPATTPAPPAKPTMQTPSEPGQGEDTTRTSTDQAASTKKTPQDAKDELQSRIDRYLGGQKDRNLLGGLARIRLIVDEWDDITIERVIQSYSPDGKPLPNRFRAFIHYRGSTRTTGNPVQGRVDFELEFDRGQWTVH